MSLLSCRKWMSSLSAFSSNIAEMTTCLLMLPSNRGTFLVSSVGFAWVCCFDSSCEGCVAVFSAICAMP
jgi:hypothetical protein